MFIKKYKKHTFTKDKNDKIEEATCFTWGDSSQPTTWSNVPYYFTKTLEKKGIKVNRVDLSKGQFLFIKSWRIIYKFLSYISPKKLYLDYFRTNLAKLFINHKMKQAIKKYSNTDIFICFSFSYSPVKFTNKKTILLGDWTVEYAIEKFQERKPTFFEKSAIKKENRMLESNNIIVTLFPDVNRYYKNKSSNININYIGNVINTKPIKNSKIKNIIRKKIDSNNIVFIGKKKYLAGLFSLIKAIELIKKEFPIELDVIGMEETGKCTDININYHGYLNKADEKQKSLYYNLLENAKIIVNTNPKWAGFSSIVESMYYCTPVVVTKYKNFVDVFGKKIDFGYYSDNDPKNISKYIKNILLLNNKKYKEMAINAHNKTTNFTWDNYIDKLIKLVTSSNNY